MEDNKKVEKEYSWNGDRFTPIAKVDLFKKQPSFFEEGSPNPTPVQLMDHVYGKSPQFNKKGERNGR